ncbi:hypothetical protein K3759_06565 [Sulfitobacter sp. W027]|jgi:hypothetical protein|uniref:hypothetical protein n=1 Tax=Sulfitobacter sp. W027 TaxID=2867025 RepID=UPI0021A6D082|nr:hypothetical protein [Sulfitobacter sp. W027]UWR34749.1 hypothetical protein K3759_06565 [Sulfitobacter sp. W027]
MPFTQTLRTLLMAGIAGEIAFELYAWLLSPTLFGVALAPANLVVALAKILLGITLPYWLGFALHVAIGIVGFSAFVWLVHHLTRTGFVLSGALSGAALWFIAQGLLAPVVGRSFMMGFGAYTQSSFVGHLGMAVVIGYVIAVLQRRQAA